MSKRFSSQNERNVCAVGASEVTAFAVVQFAAKPQAVVLVGTVQFCDKVAKLRILLIVIASRRRSNPVIEL